MKQIRLKAIVAATMIGLSFLGFSAAAEEESNKVFITSGDGSTIEVELSALDKMEVRTGDIKFIFSDENTEDVTISFENFAEMTFEINEESGIKTPRIGNQEVPFTFKGKKLMLNSERGKVVVYDLGGNIVASLSIIEGEKTLNLALLPKGVYVVVYTNGENQENVVCKIII